MNQKIDFLKDDVIEAIEGELQYQNTLTERGRADDVDHGVSGQLVTLERYTRKALNAWADNAGCGPALHEVRKVAAIACRALQLYGCPKRDR